MNGGGINHKGNSGCRGRKACPYGGRMLPLLKSYEFTIGVGPEVIPE